MSGERVVHLGAWTVLEKERADLLVEFLRRLDVEVACLIMTEWGELDVITAEEMGRFEGREQQLLATKYARMVQERASDSGVAC